MPPKPKCTRNMIAQAALELVKEHGLSNLSVREIGKRLGVSSSPIFTIFSSMDEVKLAARELALSEFKELVSDYKHYSPAFKKIGMTIVLYGVNEPEMFKLLFMQEHAESNGFKNTIDDLGDVYFTCIDLIMSDYGLSREDSALLFEQMWTLAYGLGVMSAMKVCKFTEEEIGKRLTIAFTSHVMLIKSGNINKAHIDVKKRDDSLTADTQELNLPFE